MKTVLILAGVAGAIALAWWLKNRKAPTATAIRQSDTAIAQYGG